MNPVAPDFQTGGLEQPDCGGKGLAFGSEHSGGQRIGRVLIFNRNNLLQDNGPVIVLIVHEVDRATTHPSPSSQHGLVDMMSVKALTAERRYQRGMNIDHSSREIQRNLNERQESTTDDQVNVGFSTDAKDPGAEFVDRSRVLPGNDLGPQTSRGCLGQSTRARSTGDDNGDFRVEPPGRDFADQIHQRGSTAGDQNRQSNRPAQRRLQWTKASQRIRVHSS